MDADSKNLEGFNTIRELDGMENKRFFVEDKFCCFMIGKMYLLVTNLSRF